MIVTENIKYINTKLAEVYGLDVAVSKPHFRVVWSSDQYETRTNPAGFDIYGEEGVFLRTEFGPHEVEKYPFQPDMWCLEELTDAVAQLDLIAVKYSYEPRWFFGLANSNRTPIWRAVDLLCKSILYSRSKVYDSPQEIEDKEDRRMEAEKKLFKEQLHDGGVFMGEDQVNVPSNYGIIEKEDKNEPIS